jgi:arylsulfatase A-like enzyme
MIKNIKVLASLSFLTLFLACTNAPNKKKQSQSPNIVLIVVDDLGYADLSYTGLAKDVKTPNIDAIASNGVYFSNAYATSSICSPSRGGLITGSYQQRWGTFWYGGKGIHNADFKTIPELLKEKKYATGYVGKVHYGSYESDVTNRSFPLNHGFDYYYGHTSPRKHYLNHTDAIEATFQEVKAEHQKKGQSLRQQAFWENTAKVDTIGFSTEIFGLKAREFIKKNKNNPFFLQLSFNAVHNFTHQLPVEYLEKNGLKGYHDWDPAKEEYYNWYQKGRYPNNPEGRAQYLGQLHYLDTEIGKVTDYLVENNLDKNTVIVFISDNGGSTPIYANNSPYRGSKYTLYEGGIRVPFIISYPEKYQKSSTSKNLVSAMDVLPTICDLTGIEIPKNSDGNNISKLLIGSNKSIEHDYLVWDNNTQTAVRKGKWKLRTASDKAKSNSDYEMVEMEYGDYLYDLENDPGETTNLKNEYPKVFNELKNIHKNWREKIALNDK